MIDNFSNPMNLNNPHEYNSKKYTEAEIQEYMADNEDYFRNNEED